MYDVYYIRLLWKCRRFTIRCHRVAFRFRMSYATIWCNIILIILDRGVLYHLHMTQLECLHVTARTDTIRKMGTSYWHAAAVCTVHFTNKQTENCAAYRFFSLIITWTASNAWVVRLKSIKQKINNDDKFDTNKKRPSATHPFVLVALT